MHHSKGVNSPDDSVVRYVTTSEGFGRGQPMATAATILAVKGNQVWTVDRDATVFQAAQIQRQAASESASEKFFTFGGRTGDGRGYRAGQ